MIFGFAKSVKVLSGDEFQKLLEEDDEVPWFCLVCQIKLNAEIFPFGALSKLELLDLYGIDLPSHLQTLPSFETRSKLENLPHMNDFDIDDNIVNTIYSKYHTLNEISQLNLTRKNFSIFHTNIRNLSKPIDSLHTHLCSTNIPFDIIGISETKQQVDKDLIVNVDLEGNTMHTQPSKRSCGGCAIIYVNSHLDHIIRDDLSTLDDNYETLWVELNNYKSKNCLCCCLHRHPSTDMSSFIDHIDLTLQKVQKENKTVFMMGDFSMNLLKYQSHPETNDFINLMVSHYLLLHILHPTRVTDHSATIIDNIFSNNVESDAVGGNILSQITDHFPQFLMVTNMAVDCRKVALFQRNYSKFSEERFLDDFKNSWEDLYDENLSINYKFDKLFDRNNYTVQEHVPLKKVNKQQLKLRSKPWLTPYIENLIKHRDKLLRKLRKSHYIVTDNLYKIFTNRVVRESRKSKMQYYDTFNKTKQV